MTILRGITVWTILAATFVGCGATGSNSEPLPPTRIVFRQFYRGGNTLMMENLSGRDIVKLRSKPVPKGEVPIAWVSDEEMRDLLKQLERRDFADYARIRPSDPKSMGAKGELTIEVGGQQRALLRRNGQAREEAKTYQACVAVFRQVWTENRPAYQAVTGKGDFGVKRADYERGE